LLIADAEIISAQAPNFRKIWLTCAVGALGLLGWSAFATSNKGFETASTSFYYTTGIANPQMVGSSTPHLRPSVDLRGRGSDFSGDDFYLSPELSRMPGVRRLDQPSNPIEWMQQKASEFGERVSEARNVRANAAGVGALDLNEAKPEPGILTMLLARLPETTSQWLTILGVAAAAVVAGYLLYRLFRVLNYQWQVSRVQTAINLLDKAHAADPFPHPQTGRPRELVFAERATGWLQLVSTDPSPELRLAIRGHKLEGWKVRREQQRCGEFLAQAGVGELVARVNELLTRRGDPSDPEYVAYQDAVALTNMDGLVESHMSGTGLQKDAFLALLCKEWKELSPQAQQVGLDYLINPLPDATRDEVKSELQTSTIKTWAN
jgi:hypothetical protein